MPIFARTKLVIHDDCLAPAPGSPFPGKPSLVLEYEGPNPQRIYPEIKKMMSKVYKIDEKDIQEKEFSWDKISGKFSVELEGVKDIDKFSYIVVTVKVKGEARPSKEFGSEGKASVSLEAVLRTEYPQDTAWQRSLFYELFRMLFHKLIYREKRQKYLEECREMCQRFQAEVKNFFNLLKGI